MAKILFVPSSVILALILAAAPLSAHHRWPVERSELVTVNGTVVDFVWENPHPIITLEVQNDDGMTEEWQIGGPALNRMEANGWTATTVSPGDEITGIGYQFSDGQRIVRLERVILADGSEIRVYGR
ncbi:MAG: DUF6152 family protein [Gammaproteobacteria bacterium]